MHFESLSYQNFCSLGTTINSCVQVKFLCLWPSCISHYAYLTKVIPLRIFMRYYLQNGLCSLKLEFFGWKIYKCLQLLKISDVEISILYFISAFFDTVATQKCQIPFLRQYTLHISMSYFLTLFYSEHFLSTTYTKDRFCCYLFSRFN